MSHAPYKAVKGCSAEIHEIRSAAATMVLKWDGSFRARVAKIRLNALKWIAVADSELSPTVPDPRPRLVSDEDDDDADEEALEISVARIEETTRCILRGTQIAHSASILLRSKLVAHRSLGLSYDPEHIVSLMSLLEVLKAIEKMLRVRRRSALLAAQRSTLKMLAQHILSRFDKVRCVSPSLGGLLSIKFCDLMSPPLLEKGHSLINALRRWISPTTQIVRGV